jgi:hypothetical protein
VTSARGGFSLSKWYLDCVGEDGTVFIGYWGRIRWKRLAVSYASVLFLPPGGLAHSRSWLTRCAEPRAGRTEVLWSSRRMGVEAGWKAAAAPVSRRLLDERGGSIDWDCVAPAARARVLLEDGKGVTGPGYAERISMTIPPWKLPIDELRWGRFLGSDRSVIWIDWRGPRPLSLVFADGAEVAGASVTNGGVDLPGGGRLSLRNPRTIREGPVVPAALSAWRPFSALVPAGFARARELKSLSRGILWEPSGREVEGWAIHEVVRLRGA